MLLTPSDFKEVVVFARRRAPPIAPGIFEDVPVGVADEVRPVVDVRRVDGGEGAVVLARPAAVPPPEAEGAAVAGPAALPRAVRLAGDPQRVACQRVVVAVAGVAAAVAEALCKKGGYRSPQTVRLFIHSSLSFTAEQ